MIQRFLAMAMAFACLVSGPVMAQTIDDAASNAHGTYRQTIPTEALNPACPNAGGTGIPGPGVVGKTYGGTVCPAPGISITASLGAFAPGAANNSVGLSATTTSSSVALGAGSTTVVTNAGSATAYVAFGGSGVSATTSGSPVLPGSQFAFSNGANTYMAAITQTGTASLLVTTGTGLPAVGGGGGGTGGSSITNTGFNALQGGNPNTTSNLFYFGAPSGAFQSGAFVSGSYADCAIVGVGCQADTWSGTGNATLIGLGKYAALDLDSIKAATTSASTIPVGCATVGSSTGAAANCNVSTPNTSVSGSVAAGTANSTFAVTLPKAGEATLTVSIAGIVTTAPVITAYLSYDGGATYQPMLSAVQAGNASSTISANGNYAFNVSGATNVEFVVTTAGTAATVTISVQISTGAKEVSVVNQPLVATASVPISQSATTAQLIAAVTGKAIYLMNYHVTATSAGTFQLEYGTGTLCATGTTVLSGSESFPAGGGEAITGGGGSPVIVVPVGQALCAVSSAGIAGSAAYAQQ